MQIIEPIDPNDCIQLINQHREEIKNKKYNLKIKEEWVNGFDDSTLLFLVEHCEHSLGQIANATNSIKVLEATALLAPSSALRNPNITPDIITTIFESNCLTNRHYAGDGLTTDNDALTSSIARHSKTPLSILKILAKDEDTGVRAYVAYNSKTPSDILVDLANDNHKWVREMVGGNKNTPPQILALLAREIHWGEIRQAVAANPNTPREILEYLAKNPEGHYDSFYAGQIRDTVAKNLHPPKQSQRQSRKWRDRGHYTRRGMVIGGIIGAIAGFGSCVVTIGPRNNSILIIARPIFGAIIGAVIGVILGFLADQSVD